MQLRIRKTDSTSSFSAAPAADLLKKAVEQALTPWIS
jgi:hypothetical protein